MPSVYVLRNGDEDLFKIGRTAGEVAIRVKQLATGNPEKLSVFDVIQTEHDILFETYLHRILRSRRSVSSYAREFYAISADELRGRIADARAFIAEFATNKQRADGLAAENTTGSMIQPSSSETTLYRELLLVREQEDSFRYQRLLLENRLKIAIGLADGIEGIVDGSCVCIPPLAPINDQTVGRTRDRSGLPIAADLRDAVHDSRNRGKCGRFTRVIPRHECRDRNHAFQRSHVNRSHETRFPASREDGGNAKRCRHPRRPRAAIQNERHACAL